MPAALAELLLRVALALMTEPQKKAALTRHGVKTAEEEAKAALDAKFGKDPDA